MSFTWKAYLRPYTSRYKQSKKKLFVKITCNCAISSCGSTEPVWTAEPKAFKSCITKLHQTGMRAPLRPGLENFRDCPIPHRPTPNRPEFDCCSAPPRRIFILPRASLVPNMNIQQWQWVTKSTRSCIHSSRYLEPSGTSSITYIVFHQRLRFRTV